MLLQTLVFRFDRRHLLGVDFFELTDLVVEVICIGLNLLKSALGIEIMSLDVFLSNLIQFLLKLLTFFFKAFDFNFELKTTFICLSN